MNSLGSRYVCTVCGTEMLVTRPGAGQLACCGRPMEAQARAAVSTAHKEKS